MSRTIEPRHKIISLKQLKAKIILASQITFFQLQKKKKFQRISTKRKVKSLRYHIMIESTIIIYITP